MDMYSLLRIMEGEERSIIADGCVDILVSEFRGEEHQFANRSDLEYAIYQELERLDVEDCVDPDQEHGGQRIGDFASGRAIDTVDSSSVIDAVISQLDTSELTEGPISRAIKTGVMGVLLSLTGGVKADERDVIGTASTAINNISSVPENQRKIITRELIRQAQNSLGDYSGSFSQIYLERDEAELHADIKRLGIPKPFANIIMLSIIKAEHGDNWKDHPAVGSRDAQQKNPQ